MVTVLPGDPVYTMFGHSALRFVDPQSGFDASFNYGTFDFDRSFPLRFASGRLDYRLSVEPTQPSFRQYQLEGRTILEQHLALDPAAVGRLYALLLENYRPENRYYRYDFFFDNCSTRIRDMIEAATGGFVGASPGDTVRSQPGGRLSLRDLLEPYTERRPVLGALMHTALGVGADRPATEREKAFLPIELLKQIDRSHIPGSTMVVSIDTLYDAGPLPESRVLMATWAVWLVVLAVMAASVVRFWKGRPRIRSVDVSIFAAAGVAGLLLVYLWFGSEHVVASKNLNILWAWPTHVLAAACLTKRHLPAWMRGYLAIFAASAVLFLCGLLWWTQEVPALMLPIVLLLAFRAGRCLLPASTNRPAKA
jgi:hypothetical protein